MTLNLLIFLFFDLFGAVIALIILKRLNQERIIFMLMFKTPEAPKKELVLGDYMTVHVSGSETNQVNNAKPGDMQINREELFQRIQRQRGEVVQQIQKPSGILIDVRLRATGASNKGWRELPEIINDDKIVA